MHQTLALRGQVFTGPVGCNTTIRHKLRKGVEVYGEHQDPGVFHGKLQLVHAPESLAVAPAEHYYYHHAVGCCFHQSLRPGIASLKAGEVHEDPEAC
jgi:hypothetical protein